jgi:hypothetical protein
VSEFADKEERVRRANTAFTGELDEDAVLVTIRCRKRHVLAKVYSTPQGALFVSTTKHAPSEAELARKRGRLRRAWTATLDIIDFLPDEDDVHPKLFVRCRCGNREPVARKDVLAALHRARSTGRTETLFLS